MLMSELLAKIRIDILPYRDALKNSVTAQRRNLEKNLDLYVRLESRYFVIKVVDNIFEKLQDKKSRSFVANKEATPVTLQPLINLLQIEQDFEYCFICHCLV